MTQGMTPAEFVAKWQRVELTERAASQEHFLDLCRLLGQPTPAGHDATGAEYSFEKGVAVTGVASRGSAGERGFADVWWKGKFGWEYKRRGKYVTLDDAYRQLCFYREALENPPLLIVSDIERIEIHTNFTGTKKDVHAIRLDDLAEPRSLDILRRVFTDPHSFRPQLTTEKVTQDVATRLGELAQRLRDRGHAPHAAAHFLMKCVFCLFAEDVGLLPNELFKKILAGFARRPAELKRRLDALFDAMRTGGAFGVDTIPWFNGGLFDTEPAIELTETEANALVLAANQDWGAVEPAIFGTLFERSLDPDKRSQIGAHYTSREDILLVVEPVIMAPLTAQWEAVKAEVDEQLARRRAAKTPKTRKAADEAINDVLQAFVGRLASLGVLDPACGSGNFLYVAIQRLLELEKEVITFAARKEIAQTMLPRVRPTQLHGIEINAYAAELAHVVIWIGYLQWMRDNGFNVPRDPILAELQTIENRDAILAWRDEQGQPIPAWREGAACAGAAEWPEAEFIIGNPPFLGSKVFRKSGLPDAYVEAMYASFDLPNTSDLCCYWFELARQALGAKAPSVEPRAPSPGDGQDEDKTRPGAAGLHKPAVEPRAPSPGDGQFKDTRPGAAGLHRGAAGRDALVSPRIGLLATQGIRGGDNRTVLERIVESGAIFAAWSDREWILDGAAVHVSIVGFAAEHDGESILDGRPVALVNADLTAGAAMSEAVALAENDGIAFMGDTKGGPFDVQWDEARHLLAQPNPNGRSSIEVIRPWINGSDLSKRIRAGWIIDFGCETSRTDAAGFASPFALLEERVRATRTEIRDKGPAERWWLHNRPRPDLREAIGPLASFIVTTRVSKFRLFRRYVQPVLPDSATIVFARSDDYFFGVLHSSVHELWALRMGTQLEDRPRYTPTTCFETFPLPWAPGREPENGASAPSVEPRAPSPGDGQDEPRTRPGAAGLHKPAVEPRAPSPGENQFKDTRPGAAGLHRGAAGLHKPAAALHEAIGAAARELNEQRERWLNPPEWIGELERAVDARDRFDDVAAVSGEEARRLIRRSAVQAMAAQDPRLKKRTLTNLYNERPTWLRLAHERLDRAVIAAYAAVDPAGEWDPDWAEVWVETGAGHALPEGHALEARRAEVEERALGNLLRLNGKRAAGNS